MCVLGDVIHGYMEGNLGGGVGDGHVANLGHLGTTLVDHTWGPPLWNTLGDHTWGPNLGGSTFGGRGPYLVNTFWTTFVDQILGTNFGEPNSGGSNFLGPILRDQFWGTNFWEPHLGTTLGDHTYTTSDCLVSKVVHFGHNDVMVYLLTSQRVFLILYIHGMT